MGRLTGDYAGALERELGFDRQLADRAREDLAEYLDEMADAGLDSAEAERRFGDVQDIARSYASAALPKRLRQTLGVAGWLALATFLFMRWRSMELGFDPFANPTLLSLVDGMGFLIGAAALIVAWRRRKARTPDVGGVPGEIRTHGPRIRNPVLYPAELRGH